jgi:archaellum component FlaC
MQPEILSAEFRVHGNQKLTNDRLPPNDFMSTEAATTSPASSLPPLGRDSNPPRSRPASSEAGVADSTLNVAQYYPRIQQLEDDLSALQQQVPLSMNKTMQNLCATVRALQGQGSPSVADVQRKLTADVDVEIERSISILQKKFSEFAAAEVPQSSGIDGRLADLQTWAARGQQRTDQRISRLEAQLAKMARKIPPVTESSELAVMRESADEQGRTIAKVERQLAEIAAPTETVVQELREVDGTEEWSETQEGGTARDLTAPLGQLSQKVELFRSDFLGGLGDARSKVEATAQKVTEVNAAVAEVAEGIKELEARIVEMKHLCDSLAKKFGDLTREIPKSVDAKLIQYLAAQIRSAREGMAFELASVRKQIHQYEATRPLVCVRP